MVSQLCQCSINSIPRTPYDDVKGDCGGFRDEWQGKIWWLFDSLVLMLGIVKVLIVKLSAFGDIIHSLPALDDILARPEVSEVHWLVDARYTFVTEVFPEQVKVHSIALKGGQPLKAVLETVQKMRKERFDMVFDLQGLMKSSLLARLICKKVYGLDQRFIREKPASWLQKSVALVANGLTGNEPHVVQQYLSVVQAPWLAGQRQQNISYQPPSIHKNITIDEPFLGLSIKKPMLVLNLGGAWDTKVLPEKTWMDIAINASAKGYQVVWCWGNQEEHEQAIHLNVSGVGIVLEHRLEMMPLCGLLKQASYVIAADTGILHLAAALGTATISFWGPSASWRSAPLSDKDIQVESNPHCGPCFKRTCDEFICMDMIQAKVICKHL